MLSMKYFMLYFFKCVLMLLKGRSLFCQIAKLQIYQKKLKSIYLCQAFSVKGCRWQQGFHTESCKQGNASVPLICVTVSCSPSWRRSRFLLPTSRPRWRPLWVQSVSRWNIYAKESWEHNLTRLAAQQAGSRQAQLLSSHSHSHVPCLFVLLASGLSGMNYESTLEEAASHTRKHNRPQVVAVLDKSDKLSSVVCVNAKQRNVCEPKRPVNCLSGGLAGWCSPRGR